MEMVDDGTAKAIIRHRSHPVNVASHQLSFPHHRFVPTQAATQTDIRVSGHRSQCRQNNSEARNALLEIPQKKTMEAPFLALAPVVLAPQLFMMTFETFETKDTA